MEQNRFLETNCRSPGQFFPHFLEPEDSIPGSQESATGLYPEVDKSSPHIHILYLKTPF
jgi:hypothetical protein